MSRTLIANTNIASAPALTLKGNPTSNNRQITDVGIDNSLKFDGNLLGVKLANGGGLLSDTNGLRLAPTAGLAATIIAVRQNDTTSPLGLATDDPDVKRSYPTTGNDTGVLQPYFQTFKGACDYANSNFSNNFVIYIDGDVIEGMPSPGGYAPNYGSEAQCQFFSDAQIQAAFGSTAANAAGLKAGIFAFNSKYNIPNSSFNGFAIGANLTVPAEGTVISRYQRNVNNQTFWTATRKFNEKPNKIISRYYFDTTGIRVSPTYNSTTRAMTGGDLGTIASSWTAWCPNNYPTTRTGYLGTRLHVWGGKLTTSLKNICFEYFSNAADNLVNWPLGGVVNYSNCTIACLGPGFYNYSAIYPMRGTAVYFQGSLLQDPSSSDIAPVVSFPGYGLAVVGNPADSQFGPTKMSHIVSTAESTNSSQYIWEYGIYNYATKWGVGLQASWILGGGLNVSSLLFLGPTNSLAGVPLFLADTTISPLTITTRRMGNPTSNGFYADSLNATSFLFQNVTNFNQGPGYVGNWTYHIERGPNPTTVNPTAWYPIYNWYTLPQGGTSLPGATVNTSTGVVTINPNITNLSNLFFTTYPSQSVKTDPSLLTGGLINSTTQYNASTSFLSMNNLYSITSPYNNQTYTLNYYQY